MAEFPLGRDFAWLACDADGHVAMLANAGVGPIPAAVIDQLPATDRAEMLVRELPLSDGHTLLVQFPRPDDYIGWAQRGLYAYDWREDERYEVIATPGLPLTLGNLPPQLARLAGLAVLGGLRFVDTPMLYETDLGQCMR